MNFTIHSLMYPYYTLKALRIYVPKRISMLLTVCQILQMVTLLCVYLAFARILLFSPSLACGSNMNLVLMNFVVGIIFVTLFSRLFINAYIRSSANPTRARNVMSNDKKHH